MKIAKIVEFSILTRVVIDDEGSTPEELANEGLDNRAIVAASAKILADAANYVVPDNVVEIDDDTECPYGTFDEDKVTN